MEDGGDLELSARKRKQIENKLHLKKVDVFYLKRLVLTHAFRFILESVLHTKINEIITWRYYNHL